MALVRLLRFTTLNCGCVSGQYREAGANRDIVYIEEKGPTCAHATHERNQPLRADSVVHGFRRVMRAS